MTVNLAQTEMNIRIASLWSSSSHAYSTTLIPAPSKCQNVGQLKLLAHNFLTENFPCESYSMCDQGVDWREHHDKNQTILLVCIPWIGHKFLLGQSYFCRLLRCRTSYIKCLPLLVVHPRLSAQLLATIVRLKMVSQCELSNRCFYFSSETQFS